MIYNQKKIENLETKYICA